MKKIVAIIVSIIVMTTCGVAFANDIISLNYENYEVAENTLLIYANSNEDISKEELSVLLGGDEMPIDSVASIEEMQKPTTHLFLVDVSGSISESKMEDIKAILQDYMSEIGDDDNVSVMGIGDELYIAPFVSEKSAIDEQITALHTEDMETNLYAGIIDAINILQTDAGVFPSRSLTIISDGEDYSAVGYTREEAEDKVKESDIRVNTVAMLDSDATDQEIENSKILGSFARISAGGADILSGINDTTPQDISEMLLDTEPVIISCDISGFSTQADETLLDIALNRGDEESATDNVMIKTSDIMAGVVSTPEPQPTQEVIKEEQPQPTEQPVEEEQNPVMAFLLGLFGGNITLMWIVLAAIIAAIVIIIVLVCKKRAKNTEIEISISTPLEVPVEKTIIPNETKTQAPIIKKSATYKFTFTKVGKVESESYSFDVTDELVIGRGTQAAFRFASDDLLSSRHCRVFINDGEWFVEDLASTNGTYLNGVPVRGIEKLSNDDIILVGSMELRIAWIRL